jgi:hypothetical protein
MLELKIYEKGKVVKTLKQSEYHLLFGTVKNILKLINLDEVLQDKDEFNGDELYGIINSFVKNAFEEVTNLLLDIFPDATEHDIQHADIADIVEVIMDVVFKSFKRLNGGKKPKN